MSEGRWAIEVVECHTVKDFAALTSAIDGGVARFASSWRLERDLVDRWIAYEEPLPKWAMIAALVTYDGRYSFPDGDLSDVLADGLSVVSATQARLDARS